MRTLLGLALGLLFSQFVPGADLAIVPAQDLLGLGPEARMNLPGSPSGNWRWRLKDGALTQQIVERLRRVTVAHAR